jgi:hypothetical protein
LFRTPYLPNLTGRVHKHPALPAPFLHALQLGFSLAAHSSFAVDLLAGFIGWSG